MKYRINRRVKRGGQTEVWYDLLDDSENIIFEGHIAGVRPSVAEDHAALAAYMTGRVIPAHEKKKKRPKDNYTRLEVEDLLREKGLLEEADTLDNLKTRAEMLEIKETV